MAGAWLKSVAFNQDQIATAIVTNAVATRNLPRANFLGDVTLGMYVTGTAPTISLVKCEVIANGSSVLYSVTGSPELKKIGEYHTGIIPSGSDASAGPVFYRIIFGRYPHDEETILPAKLFKTLQLRLTFTTAGTAVTSANVDIITDEYVSEDEPASKFVMKTTEVFNLPTGTGLTTQDLPIGSIFKAIYINAGTVTTVADIKVGLDNFTETPYASLLNEILEENYENLTLNAKETNDLFIDFDYPSLAGRAASNILGGNGQVPQVPNEQVFDNFIKSYQHNDVKVQVNRGTTTTTILIVLIELVPLRAPATS